MHFWNENANGLDKMADWKKYEINKMFVLFYVLHQNYQDWNSKISQNIQIFGLFWKK